MNADAFRYLYGYHFAENRKLWDEYVAPLSEEQFTKHSPYSHGSVRNQIVHLLNTDHAWFTSLQNGEFTEPLDPPSSNDRKLIRASWDRVEQMMRDYLADLHDDMLFTRPILFEEDKDLLMWQVLLHVVNHGTDHRAQLLRLLNDLGVKTTSQDYIFYVY